MKKLKSPKKSGKITLTGYVSEMSFLNLQQKKLYMGVYISLKKEKLFNTKVEVTFNGKKRI
jgi:hypothetical protein